MLGANLPTIRTVPMRTMARHATIGSPHESFALARRVCQAAAVVLLLAAPASATAPSPAGARPPNIVLILADDLGFSDVGSYGGEIPTPHLDRLAAAGVRFTQFYNSARCSPTRASLLTGRHPHAVGIGHLNGPGTYPGDLDPRVPTVAERLREAGYATYMSGKWHLTPWPGPGHNHPRRRGFDRFYGILASIRSHYNPPSLMRDLDPLPAPEGDYHFTDAVSDAAAAFVREHDASKPFFLYVAPAAPHWPIHAREADVERHLDRYREGWDAMRSARHRRLEEMGLVSAPLAPRDERVAPWTSVGPREWYVRRMAVYAAMVEQLDRGIGRILDEVERRGMANSTLVLFLSDNGGCAEEIPREGRAQHFPRRTRDGRPIRLGDDPDILPGPEDTYASYGLEWAHASNTPFRLFKSFLHEGGIATPFIARWPGVIGAGTIDRRVGHVIDLAPTLLAAAGVQAGSSEGIDLFQGRPDAPRTLFWEHEGHRAVRRGDWKLVAVHGGPWQLHDLAHDRTELTDLARSKPDLVRELASLYEAWAARNGVKPWTEPLTPIGRSGR
jgi:arylsulfatase